MIDRLNKEFDDQIKKREVFELKEVFGKLSMDVIASCAFGVDAGKTARKNIRLTPHMRFVKWLMKPLLFRKHYTVYIHRNVIPAQCTSFAPICLKHCAQAAFLYVLVRIDTTGRIVF